MLTDKKLTTCEFRDFSLVEATSVQSFVFAASRYLLSITATCVLLLLQVTNEP